MKKSILIFLCFLVLYQVQSQEKSEGLVQPDESVAIIVNDDVQIADDSAIEADILKWQNAKNDADLKALYAELDNEGKLAAENAKKVQIDLADDKELFQDPNELEAQKMMQRFENARDEASLKALYKEIEEADKAASIASPSVTIVSDDAESFQDPNEAIMEKELESFQKSQSKEEDALRKEELEIVETLKRENQEAHCSKVLESIKVVNFSNALRTQNTTVYASQEMNFENKLEGDDTMQFVSGEVIVFKNGFEANDTSAIFQVVNCMNDNPAITNDESVEAIAENSLANVQMFPNPTSDLVNVKFPKMEKGTYTITNLNGRPLLQKSFNSSEELQVNLKALGLTPGMYVMVIQGEKETVMKKIILQ